MNAARLGARVVPLALVIGLGGCASGGFFDRLFHGRPPPPPPAPPHYTVGSSYQIGGVWRYPREQFEYSDTGLATVAAGAHPRLTADGEVFDEAAMAAGHRTLQLPAIARVTDLETGRQIVVRVNDRGPADPGRLIELTRRAAELLGMGAGPAQVRVDVIEEASRAVASQLNGEGPKLAVAAAPVGAVSAESLAPPSGAAQSGRVRVAAGGGAGPVVESAPAASAAVPLRLPEQVSQGAVQAGGLYVDVGTFSTPGAANLLQRRIADLGAQIATSYAGTRNPTYSVRIGPLPSVPAADEMLARALRDGVSDARIVVQ